MGSTKSINMHLNFRQDTPKCVLDSIHSLVCDTSSFLGTGYRHPCGKPVIDFYLDADRRECYHQSDGTYYLRYCNQIKDYDDKFEAWLESIAPYIIQTNGNHVGTIYFDGSSSDTQGGVFKIIRIEDATVQYVSLQPEDKCKRCKSDIQLNLLSADRLASIGRRLRRIDDGADCMESVGERVWQIYGVDVSDLLKENRVLRERLGV